VAASANLFPRAQDVRPIGRPAVAAIAVVGVLLAGTAAVIALTGDMPYEVSLAERHALIIVTPIAVGLYAWSEGTHRRFGRLLVLAGVGWFFASLAASNDPVLHSIGRVSYWIVEAGLICLILAFPSGRLNAPVDRTLAWCAVALVGILFVPTALIAEAFPAPSVATTCRETCPENAFMLLSTEPAFLDGLVVPLRELLTVALLIAITVRVAYRIRHATRLVRRTLTPVLIVAILRLVALALAMILRRSGAGDVAVDVSAAAVSLALPLMSLGFLVGLLNWRMQTADALVGMARRASDHDGPTTPRELIATTLGDPSVELAYWRAEAGGKWVDSDGRTARLPTSRSERCATLIVLDDRPHAAVIHDPALREQRLFVETVGAYALVWQDNQRLARRVDKSVEELRESRARILVAADDERRRIERDLHDGGQQRLVALRIRLELAEETIEQDPQRTRRLLHRLGDDIDAAIDDLRSLAADVYPSLLAARGLPDAIRTVALHSPVPVTVEVNGSDRYLEEVETAAYFCCLEALQNVAKHAPDAQTVSVLLQRNGDLRFEVRDDGPGFSTNGSNPGSGLLNMRDRIEAVGGELAIRSRPGAGTEIVGRIPVASS
jgi:signal transduction histidine kinase